MPFLHEPKSREPLWKEWDYLAQKKGVRNTVYSVNGDEYTGEWLDNKKDGELMLLLFTFSVCQLQSVSLFRLSRRKMPLSCRSLFIN